MSTCRMGSSATATSSPSPFNASTRAWSTRGSLGSRNMRPLIPVCASTSFRRSDASGRRSATSSMAEWLRPSVSRDPPAHPHHLRRCQPGDPAARHRRPVDDRTLPRGRVRPRALARGRRFHRTARSRTRDGVGRSPRRLIGSDQRWPISDSTTGRSAAEKRPARTWAQREPPYESEATMFPLRSRRNTVSPLLFHTALPETHQ